MRTLTYDIAYFPSQELSGQLQARLIITKWACMNSPPTFGFNSSFISSNGTHARMSVNLLGLCDLTVFQGFLFIYPMESSTLLFFNNYQLDIVLRAPWQISPMGIR